jgi:CubicO group peptidase (beta-lactamase class C family)
VKALCTLLVVACLAYSPLATPHPATLRKQARTSSTQSTDWSGWLDMQAASFSGIVVIGRDDDVEVEAAYGFSDPAASRRNARDTRFNLGSINKTFTAVAIAQLIQRGRLSLDDTLAKHLPEYPNQAAAARITIRDLLTHRSGVAQFMRPDFGDVSVATMVNTVGGEPHAFDPGARQEYSNGGYVVLGRVIEVVSGQTYSEYVSDHVYRPAGMTASGFFRAGEREDSVALPVGVRVGQSGSLPGGYGAADRDNGTATRQPRRRRLFDRG